MASLATKEEVGGLIINFFFLSENQLFYSSSKTTEYDTRSSGAWRENITHTQKGKKKQKFEAVPPVERLYKSVIPFACLFTLTFRERGRKSLLVLSFKRRHPFFLSH